MIKKIQIKNYLSLGTSYSSRCLGYACANNLVESRYFSSSSLPCFGGSHGIQKAWEDHVIDSLEYGDEYISPKKLKKLAERIYKDGATVDLKKIKRDNCSDLEATKVGGVYLDELKDSFTPKIIRGLRPTKSWLNLKIKDLEGRKVVDDNLLEGDKPKSTKSKSSCKVGCSTIERSVGCNGSVNTGEVNKKVRSFSSSVPMSLNTKFVVNEGNVFNIVKKRKVSTVSNKREERNKNILFEGVKNIIDNNPNNKDTQIKIEKLLFSLSSHEEGKSLNIYEIIGRLNKNLKETLIKSSEDLSILIKNFKRRKVDQIYNEDSIKEVDRAHYYMSIILKEVSTDFIIQILLGKFLVLINNPKQEDNNCINIFWDLGKQTVQNYFYLLYLKEKSRRSDTSKYYMSEWRNENKDILDIYSNNLEHKIGALLIDWMREIDLLEIDLIRSLEDSKQNINVLKATKRIEPLIYKLKPLNLPQKLPMLVKPKPYVREMTKDGKIIERLGGYLLNDEFTCDELIIQNWRLKTYSQIKDMNLIYDGANNIASVGYKINKDVLDFIRLYDYEYGLTMVNSTHKHQEKIKDQKRILKWEKLELESFLSKKHVQENILAIADVYENVPEIFIPVRLDYRGRLYCTTDYLNYQGSELAKALLLFSHGEKILKTDTSSIDYLKLFGANCFGNKLDKKSATDRLSWVDNNFDNIRKFKNGVLLNQAENKLLFIAFCFEYNRWVDCLNNSESTHFVTYLPIQLDATCNGYQHLAMLGLNSSLAKQLNLKESSWNDIPDDFYSYVSGFISNYFEQKLKEKNITNKDKESYIRLKDLCIHRSVLKKAIMTIPYNASSIQGIKYLKDSFEFDYELTTSQNEVNDLINCPEYVEYEQDLKKAKTKIIWYRYKSDHDIKLEARDFIHLYKGLMYIIYSVFPSLELLTKYLKEVATICTKLGLSIPWTLPTGLVANQSYMELKDARLKPLNYSNNTFSIKVPIKTKFDGPKQKRAFMPNLIHSLDAASLFMLINNYFKNTSEYKNIYAIHDCFAVTANNMSFIVNNLKITYTSLYADKGYLHKLNEDIIKHIQNHIGDDFDVDRLEIYLSGRKAKAIKYPDISKVLSEGYDISLVKESAYIIN